MEKTSFTKLFAPFDRDGAAPQYRALRQTARERFASLPLPTTRGEDWRYTNIAPILEMRLELPEPPLALCDGGGKAVGVLVPTIIEGLLPAQQQNVLRLVFVNGRFAASLSAPIPAGVRIGSLAAAPSDGSRLAQIAADRDNAFTALNMSFLSDGAYVIVRDGEVLAQPIEIIYVSQPGPRPIITSPRTLIVVGKNAQATIVERYVGEGSYFTNAVTEVSLAEHAVVDHVKVQQESLGAYHVANTQIVQAARSNFTTHYLSLGGALVRNEVRVRFDGQHAESTVNGLYLANGTQHMDNFTVIDHAQPNCASHELYKGILNDRAHGVFNGKIFVRKDAQKTDAKQTNKVLLLSNDATIDTKPQLEIFADDVKCTHGATIGQLDATQLFYLQARGIPLDAARRILTFAFANDIVSRVKIEAIREELEGRIVQ